jgi:hypothetical protein
MKFLEKINNYPLLIFIMNLLTFSQSVVWIRDILNPKTPNQMPPFPLTVNDGLYFIVTVIVWLLLKEVLKMQRLSKVQEENTTKTFQALINKNEEMLKIHAIVADFKSKKAFFETYKGMTVFSHNDKSQEENFWNSKEGRYLYYVVEEYRYVKAELQKQFAHKSSNEIDQLLARQYPDYVLKYVNPKK